MYSIERCTAARKASRSNVERAVPSARQAGSRREPMSAGGGQSCGAESVAIVESMRRHVEMEKPLEIFARLNIKHGPNVEQIVRELPLNEEEVMVEFDLAYSKMNEKRVERLWVDLIFEGPEMNQVILRDVTFSRRPRAEL